ncbi:MAG: hypothetical protein AAGI91_17395, partial [Bacteroidota bacterium]
STGDIHGGFSEGKGAVCVEGDDLVIEVNVSLMGMIDRGTTTHRFELTDLEEVRHSRTPLRDTLKIRTRPMELISEVPGAHQGELLLKIGRRHRRDVDDLLDRLDLWLT